MTEQDAAPADSPESTPHHNGRHSLTDAALKGALAGLIGGVAMMLIDKAEQKALLPPGEHIPSATEQLVETAADKIGVTLSSTQTKAAGLGLSLVDSTLFGAVFGVVQSRLHPPDLLHGLALGGLAYGAGYSKQGLLPRLGIAPPPTQQSMERAAIPIGTHLTYGVITAAAFEALS